MNTAYTATVVTNGVPTAYVAARFGRYGTKVHLAPAVLAGEGTNRRITLRSSVPLCGTYTRPGTGWPTREEATCSKCLEAAK